MSSSSGHTPEARSPELIFDSSDDFSDTLLVSRATDAYRTRALLSTASTPDASPSRLSEQQVRAYVNAQLKEELGKNKSLQDQLDAMNSKYARLDAATTQLLLNATSKPSKKRTYKGGDNRKNSDNRQTDQRLLNNSYGLYKKFQQHRKDFQILCDDTKEQNKKLDQLSAKVDKIYDLFSKDSTSKEATTSPKAIPVPESTTAQLNPVEVSYVPSLVELSGLLEQTENINLGESAFGGY